MSESPELKQQMPQIVPETGMSQDYLGSLFPALIYRLRTSGIERVMEEIQSRGVVKYTEKFSPDVYGDVITSQNEERVRRVNELIEELSQASSGGILTREIFVRLYNELEDLIRGPRASHIG